MTSTCTAESGTCERCQAACRKKPGWFTPGEAARVADHLGVSLAELFRTRLVVDYWGADSRIDHDVFVLSPQMGDNAPGEVMGLNPDGRCTFFKHGRCEIHPVKPFECHQWYCELGKEDLAVPHVDVARRWIRHQDEITALLGHAPEIPDVTFGDVFDFLGNLMGGSDG